MHILYPGFELYLFTYVWLVCSVTLVLLVVREQYSALTLAYSGT